MTPITTTPLGHLKTSSPTQTEQDQSTRIPIVPHLKESTAMQKTKTVVADWLNLPLNDSRLSNILAQVVEVSLEIKPFSHPTVQVIGSPHDKKTEGIIKIRTDPQGTFYLTFSTGQKGCCKRYSEAYALTKDDTSLSQKPFAFLTMSAGNQHFKAEKFSSQRLAGAPGTVKTYCQFDYRSRKGTKKYAIIQERCDSDLTTKIPEHSGLALLKSVIDNLITLHKTGLVHRDIKPQNIGVWYGPQKCRTTLLDVGLACFIGKPSSICGSSFFIAPELLRRGHWSAKFTQDIWSFAVTMLNVFTQTEHPFQHRLKEEIDHFRTNTEYVVRLDGLQSEVDDQIDKTQLSLLMKELLKRTLRVNPTERISMQEVKKLVHNPRFSIYTRST